MGTGVGELPLVKIFLRTVLGAICNSETLSAPRRQPVNFASHSGGSDPWTCAAAESRGVGAAQNPDWPFLVALTVNNISN
jgi:hypothetical protein